MANYAPVQTSDKASLSSTSLSDDEAGQTRPHPSPWRISGPLVPWILTAIFASTTVVLGVVSDLREKTFLVNSFAHGFDTDFISVRPVVAQVQKVFTGGPAFDEAGQIYIPNPPATRYVGDPVAYPEIDTNWDNLTWGRYFLVTEEEARAHWGRKNEDDLSQYWDEDAGGYVSGLDVFHTLHCVNNIRKALNPDHYGGHKRGPHNNALHMDHCLEQIRQYVMCAGDVTPIPTVYYEGLGRNYVVSDVAHTCRNFEAVQEWMVDRYEGPGRVQPDFSRKTRGGT